jgi:hypothetical protein
MSEITDWPLGERLRGDAATRQLPAVAARRRSLPRGAWGLGAAGLVAGLLISAVAFSFGWRSQAQHGSSTQAALAAATARNHALAASLAGSRRQASRLRTQLGAARAAEIAATTAAHRVSRDAAALAAALVATGRSADSVSSGAGSVGVNVDRLAGELKTLTTYLSTTPTSQLDAGYVSAQTAYLAKQLDDLKAARSDLAAAVAGFDDGAKKLAERAAALSGRN